MPGWWRKPPSCQPDTSCHFGELQLVVCTMGSSWPLACPDRAIWSALAPCVASAPSSQWPQPPCPPGSGYSQDPVSHRVCRWLPRGPGREGCTCGPCTAIPWAPHSPALQPPMVHMCEGHMASCAHQEAKCLSAPGVEQCRMIIFEGTFPNTCGSRMPHALHETHVCMCLHRMQRLPA